MDIEHSVLDNGFKYGYQVTQTDKQVTLTFNFIDLVHVDQFTIMYDSNKHNIIVKRRNKDVLLQGHLYDADDSVIEHSVVGRSLILKINKQHYDPWPVVINSDLDGDIDGKSAFLLCLLEDAQSNFAKAYEMLEKAVEMGYIPAILYQASVLCNPENPYTVTNIDKSLELYGSVFKKTSDATVGLDYARLLLKHERSEEAENILLQIEDRNLDAKYELACLYMDKLGKPEVAYQRFNELNHKNYREAMVKLAYMLENGIGTEVDRVAADMMRRSYQNLPTNVDLSVQLSPKKANLQRSTETLEISPVAKVAPEISNDIIAHEIERQPIQKVVSSSMFTEVMPKEPVKEKVNTAIGGAFEHERISNSPRKEISQGSHFDVDEQRQLLDIAQAHNYGEPKPTDWKFIGTMVAIGVGAGLATHWLIKLITKVAKKKE